MKARILLCAILVLVISACKPDRNKLIETINQEQADLLMTDITADDEKAQNLVKHFIEFVDAFPNDSLAPQYLMHAAEFSSQMGNTDEAIEYLDRIISDYENYEDIALCYFLKGHFYDIDERYDDALLAYNTYLNLFPDHYLAESTRKMLPYVGMPSEELLELVQEQANANEMNNKTTEKTSK